MVQNHSSRGTAEGLSDADRQLLRDSTRDFLASRWPAASAMEHVGDAGAIVSLWRDVATQGLAALGADPAEGGLREITLVFEELGRAACPAPLLGAVIANLALSGAGAATSLLQDIRDGKAIVAASLAAFDGDAGAGKVMSKDGKLNGNVCFVEGSLGATHYLVFTDAPAGVAVIGAGASGLEVQETPGLAVPSLVEISFTNVPALLVPVAADTLRDIAMVARVVCAARALGAARRAFELAVEHAKVRKQFGEFIGSFQAVQHKLANCLVSVEGTQLVLGNVGESHDKGSDDWRVFAAAALAFAGPAIREVSIQTHRALGAIGYAEEHEAPRHFRRVHADLARFGGAPRARAELADYLLGPVA